MNCNTDRLRARVFHGLKSLLSEGDTLPPRFLEVAICESFGLDHVGDGNFYADGVKDEKQVSIKTRMMNPHVLKRKDGRDFQTHPAMFVGPKTNQKQKKTWNGLEIVQRRQALPFKDATAAPTKIGLATLEAFQANINESFEKFNTTKSFEIISVHGYSHELDHYMISVYWHEYSPLDGNTIKWVKEGYGVTGYAKVDGKNVVVCERVNGNAKREATCYKEYKDLGKIANSVHIKVPLPEPWNFDEAAILKELDAKYSKN
jgi:hypothetical protein